VRNEAWKEIDKVYGHFCKKLHGVDRLNKGSGPRGPDAPRPYLNRPFVPNYMGCRVVQ
jgi:hypothetical protein